MAGTRKLPSKAALDAPTASEKLPSRDDMKAFLAAHGRRTAEEKTGKAQSLIYDAHDRKTAKARIRMARSALTVSPLCADAYVLLADEEAELDQQKLDYFERGVAAGELALGPRGFKEFAGEFWGFLETRPYMRARSGVAHMLVSLGDLAGAISHFLAMLELNPNDNQGVRYPLLACLLRQGEDGKATTLLAEYEEDCSPFWTYGRLLLAFRAGARSAAKTMKLIEEALEANDHVPAILAGTMPKVESGGFYTPGDADEATFYAEECGPAWQQTPGAIEWLTERVGRVLAAAKK